MVYNKIEYTRFSSAQSAAVLVSLKKLDILSENRYKNGIRILNALKNNDKFILPEINENDKPAFNRLPILVKHPGLKLILKDMLWKKGIESSFLYNKPLHKVFELGYRKDIDPFPNASYLAERLITLPVHSSIKDKDIDTMIETINKL